MFTVANSGTTAALMLNPQDLWQGALGELRRQMTRPTFDTWLKSTQGLALDDGRLVVGVPTIYARDWLDKRLRNEVESAVTDVAGTPIS